MWMMAWVGISWGTTIQVAGPPVLTPIGGREHIGVVHDPTGDRLVSTVGRTRIWTRGVTADSSAVWRMPYGRSIVGLFDLDGDGVEELFTTGQSEVVAYEPSTGEELYRRPYTTLGTFVQLDGVGPPEMLIRGGSPQSLRAVDFDGGELWSVAVSGAPDGDAADAITGQFDADPALELWTPLGIVDGATGMVEAQVSYVADAIGAGDLDGDGLDEIISVDGDQVRAHRVDGTLVWEADRPYTGTLIAQVLDANGDGYPDVILTTRGPGDLHTSIHSPVDGSLRRLHSGSACVDATWVQTPRARLLACGHDGRLVLHSRRGGTVDVGRSHDEKVRVVDLDGDGVDEVVIIGGRAQVFDRDAQRIGPALAEHRGPVDVMDSDGDGTLELVGVADGVYSYDWDPRRGFVPRHLLLHSEVPHDMAMFDLNGAGTPGIAYRLGGLVKHVQPRTGLVTEIGAVTSGWGVADLNGGGEEIWMGRTLQVAVHSIIDGESTSDDRHIAGHAAMRNGRPVVVVRDSTAMFFLRYANGQLSMNGWLPLWNDTPAFWAEGRLWQQDLGLLYAWDPVTDVTWTFDADVLLQTPPMIIDGMVWLVADGMLERWPVP